MANTSERELAVAIAFLVRAPQSDLCELFFTKRDCEYDRPVTAFGVIQGEGALRDLSRLHLDPNAHAMAKAYLHAKPGSDLNLSREEIAEFNALKRGRGPSSSGSRSRTGGTSWCATGRAVGLASTASSHTHGAVAGTTAPVRSSTARRGRRRGWRCTRRNSIVRSSSTRDRFRWKWRNGWTGRNSASTTGRRCRWSTVSTPGKATSTSSQSHFYVSRSYNSVQAIGGALPVEGGTVVVYLDRTSIDQVEGFGSEVNRALGERVRTVHVAEIFERMREAEATM